MVSAVFCRCPNRSEWPDTRPATSCRFPATSASSTPRPPIRFASWSTRRSLSEGTATVRSTIVGCATGIAAFLRMGKFDDWLMTRRSRIRTLWNSFDQPKNETDILAAGHEVRVNGCLIHRQRALPPYRKRGKSLILPIPRPITPRLHPITSRTNPQERPHGRTFPIQEHHAPQGPAGCPKVEAVRQAGARNHCRGQDGPAGPIDECAVARRDHFRPPGEHVEGLHRARGEESHRR